MAQEDRLKKKLQQLGLSAAAGPVEVKGKLQFKIFFPQPPYDGLNLKAARQVSSSHPGVQAYNFTGQLLGVGGATLRNIKQLSGTKIEVMDANGNLNGAHPDPLDPELHVLVVADSQSALQKAAQMIWKELTPLNAKFKPINAVNGGSVTLTVDNGTWAGSVAESTSAVPESVAEISFKAAAMPVTNKQQNSRPPPRHVGAPPTARAGAGVPLPAAAATVSTEPASAVAVSISHPAAAAAVTVSAPVPAVTTATYGAATANGYQRSITTAAAPPSAAGASGRSNPDVSKLFANLEGFSISTPQVMKEPQQAEEPVQQQQQQIPGHLQQEAHHISRGADKNPLADQLATTSLEMPAVTSAAAARASFLLSQLEVPPAAAGAICSGPSLGVGSVALPASSARPAMYGSQQQQQLASGLITGPGVLRSSEGEAPVLPSSLLRDLSIDDDAAYSMARSRLSGPGAPPPASQPLVQQQQQRLMQPQHMLSSSSLGVTSGFPVQQAQQPYHQQPGLYGFGGGLVTNGFGSHPTTATSGIHLSAAYQPSSSFPAASQALQPAGPSAIGGGYGMGAGVVNGSMWMHPAVSAAGLGVESGFSLPAGGSGLAPGFVSGGVGGNGISTAWGLEGVTGSGQLAYGGAGLATSSAAPASFGWGATAAAGSLQHPHVYGGPIQKVHMQMHTGEEDMHSDDMGEILSLLNVGS